MKRKVYRNLLVQYKGGGYDGCYWQWNFFLFDAKGKFHNLMSTGRMGIKTKDEAINKLNTDDSYIYKLTNKKSRQEFSTETNNHLVDVIGTRVNRIYKNPLITWECDDCSSTIECDYNNSEYQVMFHNDNEYRYETKLCEDCYSSHYCGYCGAFNEPEENNIDDDGHCIHCTEKEPAIEYFPIGKFGKINKIAIHLKQPSEFELEQAKETALKDNFPLICIYGKVGA